MRMAVRFPSGSIRCVRPRDDAAAEAFVELLFGPRRIVRAGVTADEPLGCVVRFDHPLAVEWDALLFRDTEPARGAVGGFGGRTSPGPSAAFVDESPARPGSAGA